jgi:hypothetical protein
MIHALNPARKTNKPARGKLMMADTKKSSESEWPSCKYLAAVVKN